MEIRHLRYFVAVATHSSFTAAAESLGIAQPPLSQQIRDLEAEIGTELFERTTRRVTLTRAGEDFLQQARAILDRVNDAIDRARSIGAGTTGIINVGLTGSMLTGPLGPAIRQLSVDYPGVDLRIEEMAPGRQVAALRSGQIDVSFLRCPPQDADLRADLAWKETVRVALPRGHRLAAKRIRLADLHAEDFVFLRFEDSLFAKYLRLCCLEAGFAPKVTHQVVEAASLTSLVAAGFGVALIPDFVSRFSQRNVVYRQLVGKPLRADVYALRTSRNNPLAHRCIELVRRFARSSAG